MQLQRRWLRNNPYMDGNPPGRGVALLRRLEELGQAVGRETEAHWRELRSRGMSRNQVAQLREQLKAWDQQGPDEHAALREKIMAGGAITDEEFTLLCRGAWYQRWAEQTRHANAAVAAVEVRIEGLRADQARLEELRETVGELRAAGKNADAAEVALREAQATASSSSTAEDIRAVCLESRHLQVGIVHEFVAQCVDSAPELVRQLLDEGVLRAEDVHDFRGVGEASPTAGHSAH